MDKKVYNKPSLKLEVFTPNEYIATCWYIAEGDCYTVNILKDEDDIYNNNEPYTIWTDLANHGSHRVPENGYFRDEGPNAVSLPEPTTPSEYWYYDDGVSGMPKNKHSWTEVGWKRIQSYYLLPGTTHYFKEISYASNRNATS